MVGSKEKNGVQSSAKMRRITSQQGGSHLREVTNATATASNRAAEPTAPSVRPRLLAFYLLHRIIANLVSSIASVGYV